MEDTKIIEQIKNGKLELFDELIKKHYNNVYHYCYRHVNGKYTAQDLTQDVFIRVINNIDKYKHYGKFENYLYVIASNICKDYCKKKKPIYLNDLEINHQDSELSGLEDRILIKSALQKLPEVEREVVILKYYHDCKYKDIARIMNASVSVTKYRMSRALSKLKDYLSEAEPKNIGMEGSYQ